MWCFEINRRRTLYCPLTCRERKCLHAHNPTCMYTWKCLNLVCIKHTQWLHNRTGLNVSVCQPFYGAVCCSARLHEYQGSQGLRGLPGCSVESCVWERNTTLLLRATLKKITCFQIFTVCIHHINSPPCGGCFPVCCLASRAGSCWDKVNEI